MTSLEQIKNGCAQINMFRSKCFLNDIFTKNICAITKQSDLNRKKDITNQTYLCFRDSANYFILESDFNRKKDITNQTFLCFKIDF